MSESSEPPEAHGPADVFLDVFLFAPIGLVLDFPRLAPELLGEPRAAFEHACREGHRRVDATNELVHHTLDRRVQQAQRAMEGLGISVGLPSWLPSPRFLSGAGSRRAGEATSRPSDRIAPGPTPGEPRNGVRPDASPDAVDSIPNHPTTHAVDVGAAAEPGPNGHELAIPDYESLSASQVMPRLESLAPDELEAVRVFENHNRGRKTILNKIAQLQGG